MLKDGERSVVVLQQQHQNPAPIVPVRPFVQQHNNRLPPAPPAIAAAATSATFSTNTSTSSVRVSRGGSLGSSGVGLGPLATFFKGFLITLHSKHLQVEKYGICSHLLFFSVNWILVWSYFVLFLNYPSR